jgi:hypothetical protein
MPFRGIWTLRCQGCKSDFTLELKPGDQLVEFAKAHVCPHCKKSPDEHAPSDHALEIWHHVVGFHSGRNA